MITNGDILEAHNLIQATIVKNQFAFDLFRSKINSFYNEYGHTIKVLNDKLIELQKKYLVWECETIKQENGKYIIKEGVTQKEFTVDFNVFMKTPLSKLNIIHIVN